MDGFPRTDFKIHKAQPRKLHLRSFDLRGIDILGKKENCLVSCTKHWTAPIKLRASPKSGLNPVEINLEHTQPNLNQP